MQERLRMLLDKNMEAISFHVVKGSVNPQANIIVDMLMKNNRAIRRESHCVTLFLIDKLPIL